jgi:hypothetical protein
MTLSTTTSTTAPAYLLRPDWAQPETWLPHLASHIFAADPGTLHLDCTTADVPAQVIQEMLIGACEALAPGRLLPEILLHDDPDELQQHLELPGVTLPPARTSGNADGLMYHARAVKVIADAARARIEAFRFAQGRPPAARMPLVTVRIPTWHGHETLISRTLPSVLNTGYPEVEVVVVSDGPDPLARQAVEAVGRTDPRVRYLELTERPVQPAESINLHRVGGSYAANAALEAARGDFIFPLDHDDAFTDDHVIRLLDTHYRTGADFVYGQSLCEMEHGTWRINGSEPLRFAGLSHSATMWSSRLMHMRYDRDAWILREPGDWNMFRRIAQTGAKTQFIPHVVLAHFAERSSIGHINTIPAEATAEAEVADLMATGAGWLLQTRLV